MEAAFGLAAMIAVLMLCLAGIAATSAQVRCVDAAREAARLAARGDGAAIEVARRIAPAGAAIQLRNDGEFVTVTVTVRSHALPALSIGSRGVSGVEHRAR